MDKTGATILKIALTGHSRGFGPYVQRALENLGHEIIGFSRSNGYDLSTQEGRSAALKDSQDCDVFINNSTIGGYQSTLLAGWALMNQSTHQKIINISSYLANIEKPAEPIYSEWMNKKQLNETHKNIRNSKLIMWGYWKQHDFVKYHPELLTDMSIEEAIQELVDAL